MFSSHFTQELWGLEDWNLVHTWTVGRCIVYTGSGCCCLFVPLCLHFSFSPICGTLFSGTVRPRKLKHSTHVDSKHMYRVYRNQAAAAYSSLYFFIFLSLQFSNIKNFCHTFLRNCEAYKVETWYTRRQWVVVIRLLLLIHLFISSIFFFCNFQIFKKISSHFPQELWGLEDWNLIHTWTVGRCIVYTGIRL